jgi:WD40 repeat protein
MLTQAKRIIWCLSLLVGLRGVSYLEAAPVEWAVSQGGNGHFYDFVPTSSGTTWLEAERQARSQSYGGVAGHLLTITSQQELDFVHENLPIASRLRWRGGFQNRTSSAYREPDRGWKWVTGEPWKFTAWSTPEVGGNDIEPNDHLGGEDFLVSEISVQSRKRMFRWNDYSGSKKLDGFYIEYPVAICEPSIQVRLATDKGELAISISEPGVTVLIKQSGKTVKDIKLEQGQNTVKLWSGEYEVVLDGPFTGMTIKKGSIPLARGDQEMVDIFRKHGVSRPRQTAEDRTKLRVTLPAHASETRNVEFSHDGRLLATASGSEVKLWNLTTNKLQSKLVGCGLIAKFSPTGKLLATQRERAVGLYDLATSQLVTEINLPHTPCDFAYSPDGTRLLIGFPENNVVRLVDVESTNELAVLEASEKKPVTGSHSYSSVAFSPDGTIMAASVGGRGWPAFIGGDAELTFWDATTLKVLRRIVVHQSNVMSMAFSPDGRMLATAGHRDKVVKLWQVPSVLPAPAPETIAALVVQLDNDAFQTCEEAQQHLLRFGKPATALLQKSLEETKSAEIRRRVEWILETYVQQATRPIRVLHGTHYDVHSVTFSPNGQWLASGRQYPTNGQIVIWDLLNTKSDIVAPNQNGAWAVAFSPDGDVLASGHLDGTVSLWNVNMLIKRAK